MYIAITSDFVIIIPTSECKSCAFYTLITVQHPSYHLKNSFAYGEQW